MIEPHTLTAQIENLRQEYETRKTLFALQPVIIQRFLEIQGRQIADALVNHAASVHFSLPDRITAPMQQVGEPVSMALPGKNREQVVSAIAKWFTRRELQEEVEHRLNELEQSPDRAVAVSASLVRYAATVHLVSSMLPDGRSVTYQPEGDEEIPTIPVAEEMASSAITEAGDAIAEDGAPEDEGRGALHVPFVPAARRFFLPQWIAFGEQGQLLVGSGEEAEGYLASMLRYVSILHRAVSLSAYIVVNEEYQRKRYGILGQLINQGRALAKYRTQEIISKIKRRAEGHTLNRGLSLDLPYFDDQNLKMSQLHIDVIPSGRIVFLPAFVVRAMRAEEAKVAQDTRLNASTRSHLLRQLASLEAAFHSLHENK